MYMRSALFWVITQHRVVIPYRRFGTTYRSHLQGSRNPRRKSSWNLKMEPIGCPEMLVTNYHFKPQISQKSADLEEKNTGYTQKNGAVSKVNKKFISHLTRAQRTPSAAATVPVSHVLITILQCVHPGSHDTHPHGNQIHPRLGVACPL